MGETEFMDSRKYALGKEGVSKFEKACALKVFWVWGIARTTQKLPNGEIFL